MDAKTLAFGVAVIGASIGGSVLVAPEQKTTELTVKAGGTVQDEAATEVAQASPEITRKICDKVWAKHMPANEFVLGWVCEGSWVTAKTQTELDKMAGAEGVQIEMIPKREGDVVTYDAIVHQGTLPERPKS